MPTFSAVGPFCAGASIPALPNTSNNGISGTWSPAINNQQTTTYIFTPAANQCASTQTLTIVIDQPSALNIVGADCTPGPFNWVTWNNITANSATGTLGTIGMTVSFTSGGLFQTASVFSGTTFPAQYNLPINAPALAGQNTGTMTFCFNQAVTNPQIALSSLGNAGTSVQVNSSVPYSIVWSGQGMNYTSNQSFIGTEGFNILQFPGTHTCITLNFLAPEFYWNIVFGAQTVNCPIEPICQGQSIVLVAQGSNNVTWSPLTALVPISNTQVQVSPSVSTTYTITDNNACQSQASVLVEVVPNVLPQFDPYPVYCSGAIVPNLPTTSMNNISGAWSPAINNQQTTTYTFTPDSTSCATSTTLTIEIEQPSASNNSVSICSNNLPYSWNGLTINNSGIYEVLLTGQNGCDSLAILQLTVLQVQTSTTSVTVCENNLPYSWNGLSLMTSGQYQVNLQGSNGCDSLAILNFTVEAMPVPIFFANQMTGCAPLTVNFLNSTEGQFLSCQWNFGNGAIALGCSGVNTTFSSEGCYDVTLTLTSLNGCIGASTLIDLVCVTASPEANFIANPAIVSTVNPTVNFINTSINSTAYIWNFGDGSGNSNQESPSYTYPEEQGNYEVTLIAVNGDCRDTTKQLIVVQSEPIFYVPNTFTPDGDLFNQVFLPVFSAGFDPYNYNLLIFNRWGEVVFESNNAAVGWDGTYGGKTCQDGTYIWQITFKELGRDKRQLIRGHVNLLR